MPTKEQVFIGASIAALCLFALVNCRWILDNTKKGERLTQWFGAVRGIWVLRSLLLLGALFGVLLAMNVVRPMQW